VPLCIAERWTDGTVKELDFGLAKALDPDTGAGDPSESPTITTPGLTRIGVILGTADSEG
jgi:hypothetical protein